MYVNLVTVTINRMGGNYCDPEHPRGKQVPTVLPRVEEK